MKYISDWRKIRSAKSLKTALWAECGELRTAGKNDMAERWERNISRIPKKIDKEKINLILFMACEELKTA